MNSLLPTINYKDSVSSFSFHYGHNLGEWYVRRILAHLFPFFISTFPLFLIFEFIFFFWFSLLEFTRTSIFTTPILTKTHSKWINLWNKVEILRCFVYLHRNYIKINETLELATLRSTFTTLSSQSTQVLLTTTSRGIYLW